MYFEGDPLIKQDFEIAKVPAEQQHLLIAKYQNETCFRKNTAITFGFFGSTARDT